MTALIATVFLTSLVGSLHCAGMCGPFIAFCVGADSPSQRGAAWIQAAYHGGRLVSYMLLGVVAGALGLAMDRGGATVGIQRAAMMAAGGAMIVFGILALLRARGVRLPRAGVPRLAVRGFMAAEAIARRSRPVPRAAVIGLGAVLLPCGWLYMFVFAAGGTGSPLLGAVTMAFFWLGTVPVLAAIGAGAQTLFGPLRRHAPALAACLLIVVGAVSLLRSSAIATRVAAAAPGAGEPTSVEEALRRVERADETLPPCCVPASEAP